VEVALDPFEAKVQRIGLPGLESAERRDEHSRYPGGQFRRRHDFRVVNDRVAHRSHLKLSAELTGFTAS
jgi:hypothetical protein